MNATPFDGRILESLQNSLQGEVLTSTHAGYDEARKIWNGRFDRHPGAIARCTSSSDVSAAVNIARENRLLLAVRSGGHDYSGNSACDGGLVIDLSPMDAVAVDASNRTVRVEPGARWGAVDRATQAHGLATTGGTVSTVGVAGYTLGGGTGHLARRHGLGLDNLLSAEVVTARGDVMRASENENEDLFWALRGGSGNLAIATLFEFGLHEVGPQVMAGQVIHPFEAAGDVLRFYRTFMADAVDEIQCYAFFLRLPPLDFVPAEFHGKVAIDLVMAHAGDIGDAERDLAPLRSFGKPIIDGVAPQAYTELQQSFDAGMPPGNRWYSKAHYLASLTDEAIGTMLSRVEQMPGAYTMVYLEPQGGAIAKIDPASTAFPHREAAFGLHIFPGWTDAEDDAEMTEWAREFHGAMAPHSTGGVYVNLLGGDEKDGARSAYGSNYARLLKIKKKYDPDNLFRMNHNIDPGSWSSTSRQFR